MGVFFSVNCEVMFRMLKAAEIVRTVLIVETVEFRSRVELHLTRGSSPLLRQHFPPSRQTLFRHLYLPEATKMIIVNFFVKKHKCGITISYFRFGVGCAFSVVYGALLTKTNRIFRIFQVMRINLDLMMLLQN